MLFQWEYNRKSLRAIPAQQGLADAGKSNRNNQNISGKIVSHDYNSTNESDSSQLISAPQFLFKMSRLMCQ